MASSIPALPVTPSHVAHIPSRPSSKLQDSPFSDYFTDDGRSPETGHACAPSPETQQLLVRLNRLQAQLVRGEQADDREVVAIVAQKVQEMEVQLGSVHAQTRLELEDSGLFMQDDDDDEEQDGLETPSADPFTIPVVTEQERQAEHDFLILEAQRVLENVRKVDASLRQRHAELRELNAKYNIQVDEVARRLDGFESEKDALEGDNEVLRAENEALRQHLGFDRTELLWLKLQFKALEVEMRLSDRGAQRLEEYAPQLKEEIQQVKRERVAREMAKWDADWDDIARRMKGRRKLYDLLSPEESPEWAEGEEDGGRLSDWRLAVVKKGEDGKVQEVAITRVHANTEELIEEAGDESEAVSDEILPIVEALPADVIRRRQHPYISQGTQTQTTSESTTSDWLFAEEDLGDDRKAENDCAITTSSEDSDDFDDRPDHGRGDATPSSFKKNAWQELWTGLTHLAGMGDEDAYL